MFAQVMQMVSSSLFKAVPQPGMAQQPALAQQPAMQVDQTGPVQSVPGDAFGQLPDNITTHSLDELEEE